MNQLINEEQLNKKKQKVEINSAKLYHNHQKEVEKTKKISEAEKKNKEDNIKREKQLINMGVYFKEY